MKKVHHGIYRGYKKERLIDAILNFLNSDHKVLVIEYKGEKLNSILGFKDEAKHMKVPLKYLVRMLIIKFFQQPLFRLVRAFNGGELKNGIYRLFGAKIGKDVFISPRVYIDENLPQLITIEDGCIIGENAAILTHEFTIKHVRLGRVHIGKQVVVGAFSIIRSGVTIGDGAVIAMDSLINKDVPPQDEVGGILNMKSKN